MSSISRFHTVAEVAELTGLTEYQVRQAKNDGLLPWHPIGRRPLVRFTDDDLAEFARRTRTVSEPQPTALVTTRRKKRR